MEPYIITTIIMKGAKILLAIQLDKLKILRKNITGMMKKQPMVSFF
jgi:hypothetical protein